MATRLAAGVAVTLLVVGPGIAAAQDTMPMHERLEMAPAEAAAALNLSLIATVRDIEPVRDDVAWGALSEAGVGAARARGWQPAPTTAVARTGIGGLIGSLIEAARTRRVYSRRHGSVIVSAAARMTAQRKQVTLVLRW